MGTWNYGIFDDDTAYDFSDEIKTDAKRFFVESFRKAITSDYLEYDDCHAVTVSCAYIDNLLNGTQYRTDANEEADESNVNNFRKLHSDMTVDELLQDGILALTKVISDASELNELWSGNGKLYPKWKNNLIAVRKRLENRLR
ncbi:MAG: DUF4259 domain-containing protein [Anaerolineae bacterium]|nr:DUF4259 domain-containing protein [Anaerolineae bacterium]